VSSKRPVNANAYSGPAPAKRQPSTAVVSAPLAAFRLAWRLPLRREFGDKLAKVFP
jgi:hypothetical protein